MAMSNYPQPKAISRAKELYETTGYTTSDIADMCGVSVASIRYAAQEQAWRRPADITPPATGALAIERVLSRHKDTIADQRQLTERLTAELHFQMLDDEEITRLGMAIDTIRRAEEDPTAALMPAATAIKKLLSLDTRAGTLVKLTAALEKLINMERKACGVPDSPKESEEKVEINKLEAIRRVRFLLRGSEEGK